MFTLRINEEAAAGPPMAPFLISAYTLFAVQGVAGAIHGVPSIDVIAGDLYGKIWPIGLVLCSVLAIVGVILSERVHRRWLELYASLGVIALFMGYASALMIFGFTDPVRFPIAFGMFGYTMISVWRGANLVMLNAIARHDREVAELQARIAKRGMVSGQL